MFFVRVKHTPPLNKPPKCANPPKKCSTHIDHIYATPPSYGQNYLAILIAE